MKKKRKTKKELSLVGLSAWLERQAKYNRTHSNKWELLLYKYIKELGYKFIYQAPLIYKLHGYIVDYLLVDYNIFIEADSVKHHTSPKDVKKDNLRSRRLKTLGYHPLRFSNKQITTFSKETIDQIIKQKIKSLKLEENAR